MARVIASVVVVFVAADILASYLRWRHWQRRGRRLRGVLRARMTVLQSLISYGEQVQWSCLMHGEARSGYDRFIERCDASLRDQWGPGYVERVRQPRRFEWQRPLIVMSEEAQFAHYDTARRLEGLREVLAEVQDDLTALDA